MSWSQPENAYGPKRICNGLNRKNTYGETPFALQIPFALYGYKPKRYGYKLYSVPKLLESGGKLRVTENYGSILRF